MNGPRTLDCDRHGEKPSLDDPTFRIMGALVRMPPKPHDQMRLGKG
jgi:hypothetical protein